jgi:serine/threonine protein kinase
MAPEQSRGATVDARCDLFSLGVVLYRLCTGRQPFTGKDVASILLAVAGDQPPAPGEVNPAVPPELSNLVMNLLEKEPERRPASADVVVDILRAQEQTFAQQGVGGDAGSCCS